MKTERYCKCGARMGYAGSHKGIKHAAQDFHEWDCYNCGGSYMHGDNIGLWRSRTETDQAISEGYRPGR